MRQVWVVDDDEEMNRAISLMLNMLDCEVTSFHNARSAAQKLLTGKTPHLLILDINMPEDIRTGFTGIPATAYGMEGTSNCDPIVGISG